MSSLSSRTPWFTRESLLDFLIRPATSSAVQPLPLRFIAHAGDPSTRARHKISGTLASGSVDVGDKIVVGRAGRVARIFAHAGYDEATKNLVLSEGMEITDGDILCHPQARPEVVDQFAAHLIWMSDERLIPVRSYWMTLGRGGVSTTVSEIKYGVDVDTQTKLTRKTLAPAEIGFCNFVCAVPVAIDPYEKITRRAFSRISTAPTRRRLQLV